MEKTNFSQFTPLTEDESLQIKGGQAGGIIIDDVPPA